MSERNSLETWSGSLHKSFRLLPGDGFTNDDLIAFVKADNGTHKDDVLSRLPYDAARSSAVGASGPDAKRYRDAKQLFEACGLLWEDEDGCVQLSELGVTVGRFLDVATEKNALLLARHAALGLSVCQLRNPTGAGQRYDDSMEAFPNRYIWIAMLELDLQINSDELNRCLFRVKNEEMLHDAIKAIKEYRRTGMIDLLGEETLTGSKKNDRIIPLVSMAAFGWTLLSKKDATGHYRVRNECVRLLEAAIARPVEHREYGSTETYVKAVSRSSCLPKDCR